MRQDAVKFKLSRMGEKFMFVILLAGLALVGNGFLLFASAHHQEKAAFVPLPIYEFQPGKHGNVPDISELVKSLTGSESEEEEEEEKEDELAVVGETDNNSSYKNNMTNGDDAEVTDDDPFNELDLIELVQQLEYQADLEEQTGIFPEVLEIIYKNRQESSPNATSIRHRNSEIERGSNETLLHLELNPDGQFELSSTPEDDNATTSVSEDDILEGISEGVEEYLRMSEDLELDADSDAMGLYENFTSETRQFPLYLFQGEYFAEPRLNRFIDGALHYMTTELRLASMDPLFFRVLPRGRIVERKAAMRIPGRRPFQNIYRRRTPSTPVVFGRETARTKRQLADYFRRNTQSDFLLERQNKQSPRKTKNRVKVPGGGVKRPTSFGGLSISQRRKRQQQKERRRRQRLRQQRLKQQLKNRLKKKKKKPNKFQQNKNRNQNKKQQQILLNRIRRRARHDVGGGKIQGLSRVERDGDAEMQLFGNYTMIRSHMKIGPVEITLQFRTKNGIRRSGATLPAIRAHTVTRVNHQGSEMVDYLLDRPHPESIRVRGSLYPMAQKVARNIFTKLFLPNSFLVSRLREKANFAFLSKPGI